MTNPSAWSDYPYGPPECACGHEGGDGDLPGGGWGAGGPYSADLDCAKMLCHTCHDENACGCWTESESELNQSEEN